MHLYWIEVHCIFLTCNSFVSPQKHILNIYFPSSSV